MTRKLILLFVLVIFTRTLDAQAPDIVVDWGPILSSRDIEFDMIVGASEDHFFTFGQETGGIIKAMGSPDYNLACYNREDFRQLYDRELENFKFRGEDAHFKKAIMDPNGNVVVYFNSYDNKADKKYLSYRTMSKDGKLAPAKLLSEVEAKKRREGGFNIFTSKDSTKLLVYTDPPYERKEDEKLEVEVFDRDHNLLWEKNVSLPYTDKYFTLVTQTVTNNGDVFILGYSTPDKSKGESKKSREPNRDYMLFRLAADEDEVVEYDLDLDDKYISSIGVYADLSNDRMALVGFYGDKRAGGIGGTFFYTIDQSSLDVETTSFNEFDKKFLANFMSERKAEKGKDLYNFKFKDFIRKDDGGAYIIAEQDYVTVTTYTDANGRTVTTYTYHHNDLIVINIDKEGDIDWTVHVPKTQITNNDGGFYSSYLLMEEDGRLNFIYNDNIKNADRLLEGKELKNIGNPKKAVAVISTVDKDGNVTYDQLFHNKSFKAILVPKRSYQADKTSAIMFGTRGSKNRFGYLHFK